MWSLFFRSKHKLYDVSLVWMIRATNLLMLDWNHADGVAVEVKPLCLKEERNDDGEDRQVIGSDVCCHGRIKVIFQG